jgi:hypothetical protein
MHQGAMISEGVCQREHAATLAEKELYILKRMCDQSAAGVAE